MRFTNLTISLVLPYLGAAQSFNARQEPAEAVTLKPEAKRYIVEFTPVSTLI
jgi:hypothetical protein